MGIEANVTGNPITATVGETKIDVSVGATQIGATVSGGVGPTGTPGAAATVTVGTVTTGSPGSSASVVNVGSSSAAVLNFTIPAGATGSQGQTGATGATGAAGAAATISVGSVSTGAAGSSASVTNVGSSSAAVLNFTIPAGATGATGPQGPAGAAGTTTWAGITDKPTTDGITEGSTNLYHTSARASAAAPVQSVNGQTGAVTIATYSLPTASASTLGGVKVGSGLSIDSVGILSATYSYTLPAATTSTLGGVIVGSGLSVTSGTVSANVTSVAGRTGAVTIAAADVSGLGSLATQSGTFSGTSSGTNTGDQTITLTGDVTGSGTGSFAATLATTGVTAASYGSASSVATFTVDSKGRLTTAGTTAIAISSSAVSGLASISTSGSASDLSAGTVPTARLGSGTASASTYLRGDQTWATISTSPTYATTAQAQAGTATSVAMNPSVTRDAIFQWQDILPKTQAASAGSHSFTYYETQTFMQSGTTANSGAQAYINSPGTAYPLVAQNSVLNFDFSKYRAFRIRMARNASSTNGKIRIFIGTKPSTLFGSIANAGFGIEIRNLRAWIIAHNGTSLAQFDTSTDWSSTANTLYEFLIESDGSGNVTLYRNGTQIGTTTGGPTASASSSGPWYEVTNGSDSSNNAWFVGPMRLTTG